MADASRTEPSTAGQQMPVAVLTGITVEELRAVFPRWRVFGRSGICWAVRGGLVAWDGPRSLIQHVHTAPDPIALAEKLCLQEYLDRLDSQELEAVWRDMALPAPGARASESLRRGLSSRS